MKVYRLFKEVAVILLLLVLFFLLSIYKAFSEDWLLRPGETGQVKCEACQPCLPCPPTPPPASPPPIPPPTAFPVPTASPAPIQTPSPPVLGAGCTKQVTASASAIEAAVNTASPGADICVFPGTITGRINITRSCTAENPCRLRNIYQPDYLNDDLTARAVPASQKVLMRPGTSDGYRLELNGEYWIIDGFEIYEGAEAIKSYVGNFTIRNSYLRNNKYSALAIVPITKTITGVIVEDSIIEKSGIQANDQPYPGITKRMSHGLYISNYNAGTLGCKGTKGIKIRRNLFRVFSGRAIQWNGENCQTFMEDTEVTNNRIERSSMGLAVFARVRGALIQDNFISTIGFPATEDLDHPCVYIYLSSTNTFKDNTCVSSFKGKQGGGIAQDYSGTNTNTYINNLFRTQ